MTTEMRNTIDRTTNQTHLSCTQFLIDFSITSNLTALPALFGNTIYHQREKWLTEMKNTIDHQREIRLAI